MEISDIGMIDWALSNLAFAEPQHSDQIHRIRGVIRNPALPKVAAWLAETEDAVDVITIGLNSIEAINEYEYDGECGFVLTDMNKIRDRNAIAALRALVAALTPEAGDAGART